MDKKIIRAIKASIKHWEKDMLEPLREGRKIKCRAGWNDWGERVGTLYWDNGKKVRCLSQHCPLCKVMDTEDLFCDAWPMKSCGINSVWYKFIKKPNISNAKAVIRKLKSLLPKEERNG